MSVFRTPRRRLTRQRSGHTVSGITTGGQCKITNAEALKQNAKELTLTFEKNDVNLVECFKMKKAFIAFGGYLLTSTKVSVEINLKFVDKDNKNSKTHSEKNITPDKWEKIGIHDFIDLKSFSSKNGKIIGTISIKSNRNIGNINFFGFNVNVVDYYTDKKLWDKFKQNTSIYFPEIYYLPADKPFIVRPNEYKKHTFVIGESVVVKSCNRCSRYLLIDLKDELTVLSFSNHCTKKAPCKHPLFSTINITQNDCKTLPKFIQKKMYNLSKIRAHNGFQLECRSCKKFYVNAPLNPLRNSTQHKEDSLRRRGMEDLIGNLLQSKWIFHSFRLEKNQEFDTHIWEKFGKKCFNCDKNLPAKKNMALDHTMPLVYLWPLDEHATCLCSTCNSKKHAKFPVEFYSKSKLKQLSKITGLDLHILRRKIANKDAIKALKSHPVWFFDKFLSGAEYQKVRDGKRAADLIYKAVQSAIKISKMDIDLVQEYERTTKRKPNTITIK